jgi:hypothetical protein
MAQENNNYGRDQYVVNDPNIHVHNGSLPRLNKAKPNEYFVNYVITLFSLIGFLSTWIILGFFSKSEFPIGYVWTLLIACLKGSEKFSEVLDTEQREIINLKDVAFRAQRNSQEENSRLNKLDSKIILLESTIGTLYKEIAKKEASIWRTLGELNKRKERVHIDLDPLRQKYDPNLYKIKRISQIISEEQLESEESYDYLESALESLAERHDVRAKPPSNDAISNLIQDLRSLIDENPGNLRLSRLRLLKHILDMLQWTFSLKNDLYSSYSSTKDSARKNKVSHFS